MISATHVLFLVGKISLAVVSGWLISFLLIVCFTALRPGSPEYGPDFEGLFTVWIARLLSVVIALRFMFPPRIVVRADEPVPPSTHLSQGFERFFFASCAIALLGLTIGAPLLTRFDRHQASLRWQAMQRENFEKLELLLADWRSNPMNAELDLQLSYLMGQTQTPANFWVGETVGWSEQELTRLVQFGVKNAGVSVVMLELYLVIIRDSERSDELRADCFFACLAFSSNLHHPLEQAWLTVGKTPDASRFVPAVLQRRHNTRIEGEVGQWWLLRKDSFEVLERFPPPHTDVAQVLNDVLTTAESSLSTSSEETLTLVRRGQALLRRWQEEDEPAR